MAYQPAPLPALALVPAARIPATRLTVVELEPRYSAVAQDVRTTVVAQDARRTLVELDMRMTAVVQDPPRDSSTVRVALHGGSRRAARYWTKVMTDRAHLVEYVLRPKKTTAEAVVIESKK